jgi:hypothetical protein
MADEEKKYLITAEAQVENAIANLARLEAAMTRLGDTERRMAGMASASNSVTTQAQANVDAINREVAAYENLNRARRESQGGLSPTKSALTTRLDASGDVTGYTDVQSAKSLTQSQVIRARLDKEGAELSRSITDIENLKAQRNAGLQYTDISRTIGASGNEKVTATTYKEIGGSIREVSSAVTENGAAVSKTTTAYTRMGDGIYQAEKTTKQFTDTAQKGVGTLEHLAKRISFMAEWFAFYAVIQLVQKGLQGWNQAQIAISDEMVNFEIVTRGSNASAEAYLATVNAISKATAIDPAEIGPGVVAQMRVFNAPSDLALRAAQVQRVTGVDNAQVQREIMGLRLQFPDRSTINILDAFSGALKRSSLSADELFSLLETAGPLSQQFNTGLEQILGMMAGLSTVTSESGQAVELYMRQMDRLYSDPKTRSKVEQFTGKPVVGTDLTTGQEVRRPLYDVMADISKLDQSQVQEIANTIPNALGQKTRQLFVAMVNGWANVEDATKSALGAQGEFLAQNEIKMKSYAASIDSVSAAWQRLLRDLGDAGGATAAMRELAIFLDNVGTSLGRLGNTKVSPAQRAEASLKTSSIWGLLYGLAEDVLPSGGSWGPSPRSQRQMASNADIIRNRYPEGWSRTANDMSDPTKVGSMAWVNTVQFPDAYQKTEGSRNLVGDAERIYRERLDKEIAAYAKQTTGSDEVSPILRGVIMEKIGAIEAETAVYNETTGQMTVVNAEAGRFAEAMKIAGEAIAPLVSVERPANKSWNTPFGPWAGNGASQVIPEKQFELPKGVDFTKLLKDATKMRDDEIAGYRANFPGATANRTDAEILTAIGKTNEFATVIDTTGGIVGTANIALAYFAAVLGLASAAVSNLSFVTPPEGVSLGSYGAMTEQFAERYKGVNITSGNLAANRDRESVTLADDKGTYKTKGTFTTQELALGQAAAGKYYSTSIAKAEQANALLKQISDGVRSFAENLLAPTAVTEGDMALAKTGGYKDKWDEPVRKIQDVIDRKKGMNPDLGPWKGFAESMGIDTSSIASTVATGEQFKSDFYSGNKPAAFYDQYSKEGFLRAAKEELAKQQGTERLTNQAVGWLKESGMDKDVSKFIGRKLTGDVSPIEEMLYAGKDPAKVGKDIQESAKPIGEGLVKGVGSAFTFEAMYSALEAGWKLKDAEAQKKITGLGGQVGSLLTSGAATSFGDQFLDAVIAAVLARLDKEYM